MCIFNKSIFFHVHFFLPRTLLKSTPFFSSVGAKIQYLGSTILRTYHRGQKNIFWGITPVQLQIKYSYRWLIHQLVAETVLKKLIKRFLAKVYFIPINENNMETLTLNVIWNLMSFSRPFFMQECINGGGPKTAKNDNHGEAFGN